MKKNILISAVFLISQFAMAQAFNSQSYNREVYGRCQKVIDGNINGLAEKTITTTQEIQIVSYTFLDRPDFNLGTEIKDYEIGFNTYCDQSSKDKTRKYDCKIDLENKFIDIKLTKQKSLIESSKTHAFFDMTTKQLRMTKTLKKGLKKEALIVDALFQCE